MSKNYLIEKETVYNMIVDLYQTIKSLREADRREGTQKTDIFLDALGDLYNDRYSSGYNKLPKETYFDGTVAEIYRQMFYFLVKVGVIEDDD